MSWFFFTNCQGVQRLSLIHIFAQTLPVPKLKKCFALLLIVVGIRMLLKAL